MSHNEAVKQEKDQHTHGLPGVFITFEGGEGVGKSTHISFLAEVLEEQGYTVLCLREPGGTHIGEQLRQLVLDPKNDDMADETELLIYEAARAQIVSQVIKPALEQGTVVLCDRFFDSTLAYQAYGRELSLDFVNQVNMFACQGIVPDKTILMMCGEDVRLGLKRATQHKGADRLESAGEAFHERVHEGFMRIALDCPQRIYVVESDQQKSQTAAAIFAGLSELFPWMSNQAIVNHDVFARIEQRYYGNKDPERNTLSISQQEVTH